MANENVKLATS